ncbi:MAG: hypothetical protein R3A47_06290 [Polyangiales bacterium]
MPGTFILVDHSIFRAFNKGALGMLKVDGAEDKSVYSGQEVDSSYLGDSADEAVALIEAAGDDNSLKARMARGQATYQGTCAACHQQQGQTGGVFSASRQIGFLDGGQRTFH